MAQIGTDCDLVGNTKTKSKRIRSRAWFFTYNNPEEGDVARFIYLFESLKVDYVFQLEEVSRRHFQGVIRFANPREVGFQQQFDKKVHWERCRSWRKAITYCSKLESRRDGPWTNIASLRFRKTIRDPLKGKKLYYWQQLMFKLLEEEPDDRCIWWLWDKKGGTGKSAFCKSVKLKYGQRVISCSGKTKDIMFGLASRMEEGIDVDIVLMDVPRSSLGYINYGAMEKVKDGYFYSGKYESKEIVMNPPHFLVFANEEPDYDMMSKDRWYVHRIGSKVE